MAVELLDVERLVLVAVRQVGVDELGRQLLRELLGQVGRVGAAEPLPQHGEGGPRRRLGDVEARQLRPPRTAAMNSSKVIDLRPPSRRCAAGPVPGVARALHAGGPPPPAAGRRGAPTPVAEAIVSEVPEATGSRWWWTSVTGSGRTRWRPPGPGCRVEITTGRTLVEVAEVTRGGQAVRTARFMAARVVALVEHPATEGGPAPTGGEEGA